MKTKLLIAFLGLTLGLPGAPLWVEKGAAIPKGLVRMKLESPTQSMAPAMTGKEVIYYEPYAGQPIQVNDFVGFIRSDGKYVLHRVTAKNKRAIYTSGDANRWADGWTPLSRVVFIVRYVERSPVSYTAQVR